LPALLAIIPEDQPGVPHPSGTPDSKLVPSGSAFLHTVYLTEVMPALPQGLGRDKKILQKGALECRTSSKQPRFCIPTNPKKQPPPPEKPTEFLSTLLSIFFHS